MEENATYHANGFSYTDEDIQSLLHSPEYDAWRLSDLQAIAQRLGISHDVYAGLSQAGSTAAEFLVQLQQKAASQNLGNAFAEEVTAIDEQLQTQARIDLNELGILLHMARQGEGVGAPLELTDIHERPLHERRSRLLDRYLQAANRAPDHETDGVGERHTTDILGRAMALLGEQEWPALAEYFSVDAFVAPCKKIYQQMFLPLLAECKTLAAVSRAVANRQTPVGQALRQVLTNLERGQRMVALYASLIESSSQPFSFADFVRAIHEPTSDLAKIWRGLGSREDAFTLRQALLNTAAQFPHIKPSLQEAIDTLPHSGSSTLVLIETDKGSERAALRLTGASGTHPRLNSLREGLLEGDLHLVWHPRHAGEHVRVYWTDSEMVHPLEAPQQQLLDAWVGVQGDAALQLLRKDIARLEREGEGSGLTLSQLADESPLGEQFGSSGAHLIETHPKLTEELMLLACEGLVRGKAQDDIEHKLRCHLPASEASVLGRHLSQVLPQVRRQFPALSHSLDGETVDANRLQREALVAFQTIFWDEILALGEDLGVVPVVGTLDFATRWCGQRQQLISEDGRLATDSLHLRAMLARLTMRVYQHSEILTLGTLLVDHPLVLRAREHGCEATTFDIVQSYFKATKLCTAAFLPGRKLSPDFVQALRITAVLPIDEQLLEHMVSDLDGSRPTLAKEQLATLAIQQFLMTPQGQAISLGDVSPHEQDRLRQYLARRASPSDVSVFDRAQLQVLAENEPIGCLRLLISQILHSAPPVEDDGSIRCEIGPAQLSILRRLLYPRVKESESKPPKGYMPFSQLIAAGGILDEMTAGAEPDDAKTEARRAVIEQLKVMLAVAQRAIVPHTASMEDKAKLLQRYLPITQSKRPLLSALTVFSELEKVDAPHPKREQILTAEHVRAVMSLGEALPKALRNHSHASELEPHIERVEQMSVALKDTLRAVERALISSPNRIRIGEFEIQVGNDPVLEGQARQVRDYVVDVAQLKQSQWCAENTGYTGEARRALADVHQDFAALPGFDHELALNTLMDTLVIAAKVERAQSQDDATDVGLPKALVGAQRRIGQAEARFLVAHRRTGDLERAVDELCDAKALRSVTTPQQARELLLSENGDALAPTLESDFRDSDKTLFWRDNEGRAHVHVDPALGDAGRILYRVALAARVRAQKKLTQIGPELLKWLATAQREHLKQEDMSAQEATALLTRVAERMERGESGIWESLHASGQLSDNPELADRYWDPLSVTGSADDVDGERAKQVVWKALCFKFGGDELWQALQTQSNSALSCAKHWATLDPTLAAQWLKARLLQDGLVSTEDVEEWHSARLGAGVLTGLREHAQEAVAVWQKRLQQHPSPELYGACRTLEHASESLRGRQEPVDLSATDDAVTHVRCVGAYGLYASSPLDFTSFDFAQPLVDYSEIRFRHILDRPKDDWSIGECLAGSLDDGDLPQRSSGVPLHIGSAVQAIVYAHVLERHITRGVVGWDYQGKPAASRTPTIDEWMAALYQRNGQRQHEGETELVHSWSDWGKSAVMPTSFVTGIGLGMTTSHALHNAGAPAFAAPFVSFPSYVRSASRRSAARRRSGSSSVEDVQLNRLVNEPEGTTSVPLRKTGFPVVVAFKNKDLLSLRQHPQDKDVIAHISFGNMQPGIPPALVAHLAFGLVKQIPEAALETVPASEHSDTGATFSQWARDSDAAARAGAFGYLLGQALIELSQIHPAVLHQVMRFLQRTGAFSARSTQGDVAGDFWQDAIRGKLTLPPTVLGLLAVEGLVDTADIKDSHFFQSLGQAAILWGIDWLALCENPTLRQKLIPAAEEKRNPKLWQHAGWFGSGFFRAGLMQRGYRRLLTVAGFGQDDWIAHTASPEALLYEEHLYGEAVVSVHALGRTRWGQGTAQGVLGVARVAGVSRLFGAARTVAPQGWMLMAADYGLMGMEAMADAMGATDAHEFSRCLRDFAGEATRELSGTDESLRALMSQPGGAGSEAFADKPMLSDLSEYLAAVGNRSPQRHQDPAELKKIDTLLHARLLVELELVIEEALQHETDAQRPMSLTQLEVTPALLQHAIEETVAHETQHHPRGAQNVPGTLSELLHLQQQGKEAGHENHLRFAACFDGARLTDAEALLQILLNAPLPGQKGATFKQRHLEARKEMRAEELLIALEKNEQAAAVGQPQVPLSELFTAQDKELGLDSAVQHMFSAMKAPLQRRARTLQRAEDAIGLYLNQQQHPDEVAKRLERAVPNANLRGELEALFTKHRNDLEALFRGTRMAYFEGVRFNLRDPDSVRDALGPSGVVNDDEALLAYERLVASGDFGDYPPTTEEELTAFIAHRLDGLRLKEEKLSTIAQELAQIQESLTDTSGGTQTPETGPKPQAHVVVEATGASEESSASSPPLEEGLGDKIRVGTPSDLAALIKTQLDSDLPNAQGNILGILDHLIKERDAGVRSAFVQKLCEQPTVLLAQLLAQADASFAQRVSHRMRDLGDTPLVAASIANHCGHGPTIYAMLTPRSWSFIANMAPSLDGATLATHMTDREAGNVMRWMTLAMMQHPEFASTTTAHNKMLETLAQAQREEAIATLFYPHEDVNKTLPRRAADIPADDAHARLFAPLSLVRAITDLMKGSSTEAAARVVYDLVSRQTPAVRDKLFSKDSIRQLAAENWREDILKRTAKRFGYLV